MPVFTLRALRRLRKKREIARIRQPGRYRLARVVFAHRPAFEQRAPRRLLRARHAEVQLRRQRRLARVRAPQVFQRAPAASAAKKRLRRALCHGVARLPQQLFQPFLRDERFEPRFHRRLRAVPRAVDLRRAGVHRAVGLQPFPCRVRRHGQALILRLRKPRLNFDIAVVRVSGQKLLPPRASARLAPDEQLPPALAVRRGLHQAPAVRVQMRDILPPLRRDLPEMVDRLRIVHRVGHVVAAAVDRHAVLEDHAVPRDIRRVRRNDHAPAAPFRHGDIAPPVGRDGLRVFIDQPHPREQHPRAVRQEKIHLEAHAAQPLVFVHAQHRRAVRELRPGGEQRRAGERVMADDRGVPLHAAGKPRIAHGKIAGVQRFVLIQQISAGRLVCQRDQPSAELRQKPRAQKFVFQHDAAIAALRLLARVHILRPVREHVAPEAVAEEDLVVLVEHGLCVLLHVGQSLQPRQTALLPDPDRPDPVVLLIEFRHHRQPSGRLRRQRAAFLRKIDLRGRAQPVPA